MSCQKLDGSVSEVQPAGKTSLAARMAGSTAQAARMAADGFCRAFNFAPPVVIPPSQIVFFDATNMTTFAADPLFTF